MNHQTAQLYVISAASGTGKSTLIQRILKQPHFPKTRFSISHTTRAPREGEQNGVHYHFIDNTTFEKMIEQNAFVEHAKVYSNYYGTSFAAIQSELNAGYNVILDIDWQGAEQVRQRYPDCRSIFILPPSVESLRQRLQGRGQDDSRVIEGRMQQAQSEILHYSEYDYLIINDCLDTATEQLTAIFISDQCRATAAKKINQALLNELLSQKG